MVRHGSTSLAALIGSRICHDLINPIGAIANGLELVAMAGQRPASPEMTLIQQSCDNAAARIRFFRIAFGTATDGHPIPATAARKTLVEHFSGTRIRPDWDTDQHAGRQVVQLAYLAALCLETALPHGGDIRITVMDQAVIAFAFGPVIAQDEAVWALLDQAQPLPTEHLRAAHVQFALLAQLCADQGQPPMVRFDAEQVRLEIPLGMQAG